MQKKGGAGILGWKWADGCLADLKGGKSTPAVLQCGTGMKK